MIQLDEYQIEQIEDTLRLVANALDSYKRESCLDREVMLCWNWCYDALHNIDPDETSKNDIMYRMRVGQYPGDHNVRLNKKSK